MGFTLGKALASFTVGSGTSYDAQLTKQKEYERQQMLENARFAKQKELAQFQSDLSGQQSEAAFGRTQQAEMDQWKRGAQSNVVGSQDGKPVTQWDIYQQQQQPQQQGLQLGPKPIGPEPTPEAGPEPKQEGLLGKGAGFKTTKEAEAEKKELLERETFEWKERLKQQIAQENPELGEKYYDAVEASYETNMKPIIKKYEAGEMEQEDFESARIGAEVDARLQVNNRRKGSKALAEAAKNPSFLTTSNVNLAVKQLIDMKVNPEQTQAMLDGAWQKDPHFAFAVERALINRGHMDAPEGEDKRTLLRKLGDKAKSFMDKVF